VPITKTGQKASTIKGGGNQGGWIDNDSELNQLVGKVLAALPQ